MSAGEPANVGSITLPLNSHRSIPADVGVVLDSETPAAPIGRCRPVRYRGPMRMRRADREITDPVALRDIVAAAEVGHLGLMDDEGIYVVPLSFVHTVREDGREVNLRGVMISYHTSTTNF